MPAKPPRDDPAWPWFDSDTSGQVTGLSAGAERVGVRHGMALAPACALLAEAVGALDWRSTGPERWRCQPALANDAAGLQARLVQAGVRLKDEMRRRRLLERQLLRATEGEQRRISLELHDGLGQHLSGLAFTARSLAERLRGAALPQADEADWLARLLRDAVGRVRAMSRGLWPVSLERQSLPQALSALAQDVEQLYGISVVVEAPGFEAESATAAHHLFRVVQESVHNALKHGQARHITVRLERLPPKAMLSIVSDGLPLAPARSGAASGLGLVGMQLRAEALGGELQVESLPGGGVEVCLLWTPTARRAARLPEAPPAGDGWPEADQDPGTLTR